MCIRDRFSAIRLCWMAATLPAAAAAGFPAESRFPTVLVSTSSVVVSGRHGKGALLCDGSLSGKARDRARLPLRLVGHWRCAPAQRKFGCR